MRRFPFFALLLSLLSVIAVARAESEKSALGPSILRAPVTERVAEQGILTPVPVRLDLPPGMKARRVLVHYKLFGAPEWTTLELSRAGTGWAGIIPCLEVSTVTGDLIWYIRAHDADGGVVAYSGSRHLPYRVRIVHPSARPGIGKGRCPDPADCPAGLPGCPSEPVIRTPCKSDTDCEGGKSCGWDGFCESTERPRNWLSIEAEQDLGLVSTAGACSLSSQEREGYGCFRADGERYLGNPVHTNEPVRPGLGPTRVVIGYERLFFYGSTVGLRAGWAFAGKGPTPRGGTEFFPFLFEARLAHWFGADPFARSLLRPYVYVNAGAAMFDVTFTAHVREDPRLRSLQGGNELEQDLDAWKRAGDAFVGAGLGIVVPFSIGVGTSLEVGFVQAFPFGATILVPRAGFRFGF